MLARKKDWILNNKCNLNDLFTLMLPGDLSTSSTSQNCVSHLILLECKRGRCLLHSKTKSVTLSFLLTFSDYFSLMNEKVPMSLFDNSEFCLNSTHHKHDTNVSILLFQSKLVSCREAFIFIEHRTQNFFQHLFFFSSTLGFWTLY